MHNIVHLVFFTKACEGFNMTELHIVSPDFFPLYFQQIQNLTRAQKQTRLVIFSLKQHIIEEPIPSCVKIRLYLSGTDANSYIGVSVVKYFI